MYNKLIPTRIVEITGVFGAGYIPNNPSIPESIAKTLENDFRRKACDRAEHLKVSYIIDNTLAQKANINKHNRIDDLIDRQGNLTSQELAELKSGLEWVDQEACNFVNHPKWRIDMVIRRGGVAQAWPLFRHEAWRDFNNGRIMKPHIIIFITASLPIIQRTYQDPNFQEQRLKNPRKYCDTPERAFIVQQEWSEQFREIPYLWHMEGLQTIERTADDAKALTTPIINKLILSHNTLGFEIIPRFSVFISHSHKDKAFAMRLQSALELYHVNCFLSDLDVFSRYEEDFKREIELRNFTILILTAEVLESKWVKYEFDTTLECEKEQGRRKLIVIGLDDQVLKSESPIPAQIKDKVHVDMILNYQCADGLNEFVNRLMDTIIKHEHANLESESLKAR